MKDIKVRAQSAPWNSAIELIIAQGDKVGTKVILEKRNPGEYINPTLSISYDEAQCLMDDLWHSGLRPTEGSGSAGSLRATEAHLKDMQKIVFKQLEID